MSPAPDEQRIRERVKLLSELYRPSASAGEHRAAELIRDWLRQAGFEAGIEREKVHGNYWAPLGLLSLAGVAAGSLARRGRLARLAGAALGTAAAAGVWDDVTAGEHHVRRLLPKRETSTVVATLGPEDAQRTLVLVAHHDAAKSGLIFHPAIPELAWRIAPEKMAKTESSPALMAPVLAGPALAALGAALGRPALGRAGKLISGGAATVFAEIATRKTVPGANDNISGVVCLLELAEILAADPLEDLRVMIVSTGSEESLMEGMHRFARRHFPQLDRERTFVLCVDTVGSQDLCLLSGEGMLKMYRYPPQAVARVAVSARRAGVKLIEGLKLRNSTDGLYALKAGYQSAMIGSISDQRVPENYHWHTDTHDRVHYDTLGDAVRLCHELARSLAREAQAWRPLAGILPA